MTRLELLLPLVAAAFAGADTSLFRFEAPLNGDFADQAILRVKLPAEVIARAHDGFADLRLVDEQGGETPYVLYEAKAPEPPRQTFVFKPTKYQSRNGRDELTLARTESDKFDELDLSVAGRDFNKSVRVETSDSGEGPWALLAEGTLFDFSSHVDLRKTKLAVPETGAKFLRATLADVNASKAGKEGAEFELRYKGLELKARGREPEAFRINAVTARLTGARHAVARRDVKSLEVKATKVDETKSTVLDLGEVALPLRTVKLTVATPYYYRRLEAWTSATGKDKEYALAASAAIFRVPGMPEAQTTINLDGSAARFLRLRIVNGDNPPLDVSGITGEWVPISLHLIGAKGRRYRLYVDADGLRAPSYELEHVLPAEKLAELGVQELTLGAVVENASYRAPVPEGTRQQREKLAFTAVIVAVALCLGVWIFRLVRKLPS